MKLPATAPWFDILCMVVIAMLIDRVVLCIQHDAATACVFGELLDARSFMFVAPVATATAILMTWVVRHLRWHRSVAFFAFVAVWIAMLVFFNPFPVILV